MLEATDSINIKAKPDKVFRLVTNHDLWPNLLPSLNRVWETPNSPMPVGQSNKWEFLFMGIPFRGSWTVTKLDEPNQYEGDTSGSIASHWTFTFQPIEEGTKLTLKVEYKQPISKLKSFQQHFIERHYQKEANTFLDNIKRLCEG